MTIKKILICLLSLFSLCYLNCQAENIYSLNYLESLETFDNPERGFYHTYFYNFKPENNKISESGLGAKLVHLRLNLGNFSKAVNKDKDLLLTSDMLNAFEQILQSAKKKGSTVIIRFAYDSFNGTKNLEPSMDVLLKHVEAISKVIDANKEVVSYVELGFFGPWGEMHSSDICNYENVSKALNVMLENTSDDVKIGVRHPGYYTNWANLDRAKLNEYISQKGTKEYRVGLFNDGYLGSGNDLGTFKNREVEIGWLKNQATHTLYGGEVVANYGSTPLNTANYMAEEAFTTHTSYLNYEWNQSVINAWKDEIYNGSDSLYKGKSGYLYIINHLGYRLVLRNSDISVKNKKLNVSLAIENVGFANIINPKKVSIILENGTNTYEFGTNIDPTLWASKQTSNVNTTISLLEDINLGDYNVFLRISYYGDYQNDNNYQTIRLANDAMWNEETGSNYIGNISINADSMKEVVQNEEVIPNNSTTNQSSSKKKTVRLKISNCDAATKQELAGSKLILKKATGEVVATWTSTNTPHIVFDVEAGDYVLVEEGSLPGYELTKGFLNFSITENDKDEVEIIYTHSKIPQTLDKGWGRNILLYAFSWILFLSAIYTLKKEFAK